MLQHSHTSLLSKTYKTEYSCSYRGFQQLLQTPHAQFEMLIFLKIVTSLILFKTNDLGQPNYLNEPPFIENKGVYMYFATGFATGFAYIWDCAVQISWPEKWGEHNRSTHLQRCLAIFANSNKPLIHKYSVFTEYPTYISLKLRQCVKCFSANS